MDRIDKSTLAAFENLGLTKPKEELKTPKLGQEDFIKLMTTQMNNQDPFKPMENGDFLGQMAQFSSVTGLKEIKDSFNSLATALKSNQALQASSMVGRKVLIPGNMTTHTEGNELKGAVELETPVADVKVSIVDDKGALVKEMTLGNQQAGLVNFSWDGKLADGKPAISGNYQMVAQGNVDGKGQSLKTLVTDTVQSVSLGKAGEAVKLTLANAGSASLADVQEIM